MIYKSQKLPVYNICVVDVVFRIEGELYNKDKIIIDKDTFDFAGHMANDIIIGFYEDGCYKVSYFREITDEENPSLVTGIKKYNCDPVKFDVGSVENLVGTKFNYYQTGISLEIIKNESSKKIIDEIFRKNSDMLELQI